MAAPSTSSLKIAPTQAGYLVVVDGRGTALDSCALHEHATQVLEDGRCRLTVDLSACEYLDSTFLGCLAQLDQQFGRTGIARFVVAGPRDHCESLFGPTRLETLLTIVDNPPEITGNFEPIQIEEMKRRKFGHHVMESHRQLAQIEGPEQSVFAEIAAELARELSELSAEPDPVIKPNGDQ